MSSKKILLIFLILFLPLAVAQNQDFILNYIETADYICPTSTSLYTFQVNNIGNTQDQYTITLSGDASKWATAVPTGFSLTPGNSKTIYVYITPKSDSLPGKYNLIISVSNSKGLIKTINHEVDVKDCHQVEIIPPVSQQSCPCDLVKYEFTIKNTGEFDTIYDLEVGGSLSNSVTLSENVISVKSGKSTVIYAYVEDLCEIGNYDLTLTAKNKAVSSATTSLNINSCFDYILSSNKDYISLCENSNDNFLITITNNGNRVNNYFLSVDGPEWTNLEKASLILNPEQSGSVKMFLSPGYNIEGSFDINLKAVSEKGNILAIKPLKVDVKKCYNVLVDIIKDQANVCNSFSGKLPVIIKNTGNFKESFNIRLEGPEWTSIDKNFLEINPNEEKTINLNFAPLIDTLIDTYNINIIAESIDKDIRNQDNIKVKTLLREECYKPQISIDETDIKIGKESSSTFPITIENKGSEIAVYNLALSGTASSWIQLNPSIITVEPNRAEVVYLYIAPSEEVNEGSYNIEVSARLEDTEILEAKNIKINVLKEAPTPTTISEDKEPKIPVTGLFSNIKENVSAYKYYGLIGIVILILIIIAITRITKKKEVEEVPAEIEEKKVEVKEEHEIALEEGFFKRKSKLITVLILAAIAFVAWKYELWKWVLAYKYYILAAIAILTILIISIRINIFKKIINFFEEEEEDLEEETKELEEKPSEKKIEVEEEPEIEFLEEEKSKKKYWIVGILVLAALIYIEIKYKYFSLWLSIYKYYILAAIAILIIIIVAIKTKIFKKIIDFFEEEEEDLEEKKEEIKKEESKEERTKEKKVEPKKPTEKKTAKKETKKKDDEEVYY